MQAIQIISQDLFDKVRSRFSNLEMGDETGAVTIDPALARFFDFDFVVEGNDLGRVSISLNELGSLKVYYSQGITENQDDPAKQGWYKFLKEMRFFAMRRLLRFDTRDISKTNLDKNDFQHLAATQAPKEPEMPETMNESRWNDKSTKKTSRAVRGATEVIVRHARAVDEMYPGARSQRKNIKAIFIQNRDGERFKYPFIHPAGAFAMAQHVDHGGVPHDPAGKAIIKMSEEIAQLQEFQRKISRSTLHDDATGITEKAVGRLQQLKAQVEALGKRHHYEAWAGSVGEGAGDDIMELDAVTMEQYKQAFTQTSFQEELAGYFPLLHKIMSEENTVDLENYVSEEDIEEAAPALVRAAAGLGLGALSGTGGGIIGATLGGIFGPIFAGYAGYSGAKLGMQTADEIWDWASKKFGGEKGAETFAKAHIVAASKGEDSFNYNGKEFPVELKPDQVQPAVKAIKQVSEAGTRTAFENFEAWAEAVEQGKLTDDEIDELKQALADTQELQLGPDGQTAFQFFSEFGLDSDELENKFKAAAELDPKTNPVEVFQLWAQENYPELLVALGLSGTGEQQPPEQGAEEPAPEEPAAAPEQPTAENEDEKGMEPVMSREGIVKEVAKIVKSFYNADNPNVGPFRGGEGIALDCKKQIEEKFGPKAGAFAEQIAGKFIERLTNEWNQKHGNVGDDGLARLKELVQNLKGKVESIGDQGGHPGKNIMPAEGNTEMESIMKLAGLAK